MKVLVHFKHKFSSENGHFSVVEKISKVFDVKSENELLEKFDQYDFIPPYVRALTFHRMISDEKKMLWFLTENGKKRI
jgi:hypothetical protein